MAVTALTWARALAVVSRRESLSVSHPAGLVGAGPEIAALGVWRAVRRQHPPHKL